MDTNHLSKLQSVFSDSVDANKVAGLNCLVYKDNKEMYSRAGFEDIDETFMGRKL